MRPNMSEAIYQSSTTASMDLLLEEVNSQEVLSLYPLLFFYATILIVGVLGNALVLLVYSFRYRRSPARVYILFLAAIDFLMCACGLPYHLIDMTHPYTYTNVAACKTLTFIMTTLFHMSIFGLIVIAVDRYLKICRPLGKVQISYFGKKRACGAAILAAILMSWPNVVLYGPSEMESPHGNVTGYACFFETSYLETNYPFIYIMSTLCICLGSTIFLIVSYSLIVNKICTRYKSKTIKLTGRSAFDDSTLTEDVYFKNGMLPTQQERNNTHETKFSRSNEELNGNKKGKSNSCNNIVKCLSDNGNLNICEERLVICNSNGSLTFVGEEDRKALGSIQNNIHEQNSMDDSKRPLLRPDTEFDFDLKRENVNMKSGNTSSTYISKSIDTGLFDNTNKQFGNKHVYKHSSRTDLGNGSLKLFRIAPSRTMEKLHRSSDQLPMEAVNIHGCRKDGRYSLQVPELVTLRNKNISLRRTSDITGVPSKKTVQHWNRCSAIALENLKQSKNIQDNGLRIHSSSQSVNVSSQGTFKAKKTVTKQHSKITKIMLTITIIFVLSYSPALVVTIWTAVQPEFWDILDERETIFCEFLLRFYLINNICNPFIYGFWDKRFKREIIYTFRKISLSLADKFACCVSKKS